MAAVGLWLFGVVVVGYVSFMLLYLIVGLWREGGSRAAYAMLLIVAIAVFVFVFWVIR